MTLRTLGSIINDRRDLCEPRADFRAAILRDNALPELPDSTLVHEHCDGSIDLISEPAEVARKFAFLLLRAVGESTYAKIVARNGEANAIGCASHDYCDANAVMERAFREYDIEFPEVDMFDDDEDARAAFSALWDAAWTAWRAAPISILATLLPVA